MSGSFLIAAASSGSGKTTLTIGLLRALTRKGLFVLPYKCGPDYIDPQYHRIACGHDSENLDIWMNGKEEVCKTFNREHTSLKIIEGAMGLYDGADGMQGSAAEVAELLNVPVILVINARSMAHSVAPLLYGYLHYRPQTKIAGVIYNNVGSERHYRMLCRAADEVGMPVLGYLPRMKELYAPFRHLGLDISETEKIDSLANLVADNLHIDLSTLESMGEETRPNSTSEIAPGSAQIYIARDAAFNFLYPETVHRFSQLGEVHFFSPLQDEEVSENADIIYLPGGYPEFFLSKLSASRHTIQSLQHSHARILAECGGMMYLGQAIDNVPMAGLLPLRTTMQGARLHLGYRTAMLSDGTQLRGHEFHYSTIQDEGGLTSFLQQTDAQGKPVGTALYKYNNLIAGYTHWSPAALIKLATL